MKKIILVLCTVVVILSLLSACSADTYISRGEKYLENNNYEKAIVSFNKAISLDPTNELAYLCIADTYVKSGDSENAIETLIIGFLATDCSSEMIKNYLVELLSEKSSADNDSNLLLKTAEYAYSDDGSVYCWATYEYDVDGNIVLCKYYDEDGNNSYRNEFEYDSNGNVSTRTVYKPDGELGFKYEYQYEYDSYKKIIKKSEYNCEVEKITSWYEYEYNYLGKLIKENHYTASGTNGKLTSWVTYEYNENGNCIEKANYTEGAGKYCWERYEYDECENCIKMQYYGADGLISHECEYDMNGEQILYTTYDSDGSVKFQTEYDYITEYGDSGNIIFQMKITYSDGVATNAEYRTYT